MSERQRITMAEARAQALGVMADADRAIAEERNAEYRASPQAEIDRLEAELARVTAERDRLIERWPCDGRDDCGSSIEWMCLKGCEPFYEAWVAGKSREFATKTEAVRYTAGLDGPKGEDHG